MPVLTAELVYRLSGGASNTVAGSSLGGAMSTVAGGIITTAVINNLWDDVSGAQAESGTIEYRGFYIRNENASLTLQAAVIWIDSPTSSADTEFDIALAAEAVNVAMAAIPNESTAPVAVTFTRPVTKGGGLSIGNIPPGQFKGCWVRRTVNAAVGAGSDSGSMRVEGETIT